MIKTVKGKTDHVVIVGAGLAGLSAAIHLASSGRKVTILERETFPGGRNGILKKAGYSFDTGPTVLTMPSLIEEIFDSVGEKLSDWLDLMPLEPLYRTTFHDGSVINVYPEFEKMSAEIESKIGSSEAAGYKKYVDFVTKLYKYEMNDFIDRNIDSPFQLLTPNLAKLIAIGGFRKLAPKVSDFLKDERTQKIFSFQAMYAGVSPQQALAIYAVIAYMDSINGVYFPRGGMHALPRAMAAVAQKHGVEIKYGFEVDQLEVKNNSVVAAISKTGDRVSGEAFVLNPDLPIAWRDLLGITPRKVAGLKYSPSCFLMLAGSSKSYPHLAHHNIHFGNSWDRVFTEIIDDGKLMSDPSFLVTVPSKDDPTLAPSGKESYYILFPTPNLSADINWKTETPKYRESILKKMEATGYSGFADSIEVEDITTPLEWKERGMEMGAPFASAHTFFQTGPFRPSNLAKGFSNVVFTGSGTQPGVGVPMVLISGKLAAQRITGKK
jgi:phytoene desaturase